MTITATVDRPTRPVPTASVTPGTTGAELLLAALVKEGVDTVFGIPGGANLPIYQHLPDFPLRHVLVRHEQGAAHMADGYARASGKVGVCVATSGPGALNLITGLATAHFDSVPVVAITGQVAAATIGTDAFQESDVIGSSLSVTKHSYQILDAADIPSVVAEAFHIARTGRPGAVLIDVPKDVQQQRVDGVAEPIQRQRPHRAPGRPDRSQLIQAAGYLKSAERPMILAGRGVAISGGQAALREIAESCDAPVGTTLLGTGIFPSTHPLALGLVGFMGTGYCNRAVTNCDVLLMVGMRADDRVTCRLDEFAPRATHIIHINIDPAELGKTVKADCQIVGDARAALEELHAQLAAQSRPQWRAQLEAWRVAHPLRHPNNGLLQPQEVLAACYARLGPDDITVADVGLNQIWAAVAWTGDRPGHFLNSGGQGTMGFALPAAIGAQAAFPERQVLSVSGEGGFVMTLQELATAVESRLPVKAVVLNNRQLGMVRQFQDDFYGGVRSQVDHLLTPDFVMLAQAFGCFGAVVHQSSEIGPALDAAFAHPGPAVVDFEIDPNANVYPIVPLGKGLSDFVECPRS
ncbi:MAG TPA: biosynthetic-type acetolactate synthase large subunit [Candidatus Dormibacteraeota bacterium]|nr:biosynthetic-type acetolactate synthase large subunit [Candidatus Dormibacteraeota bacterium]